MGEIKTNDLQEVKKSEVENYQSMLLDLLWE